MAISRSLMNRQLQANGGIMQVAPREKFGLGSSLKKFVRKIIPNEVAEVAVKAAPFVAPFNPAVAAAMSGLGSFDQTGSIGDSLKSGALTYGLGQGARYLGGAGFQGNPFAADGGAFRGGLEGFKSGFSSPLGNQTGFKLGKPVEAVEGVGIDTSVPLKKPDILAEQMSEVSLSPNNLAEQMSEVSLSPSGSVVSTVVDKSIVTKNDPGFLKNLFDGVSNQDYGKIAKTIGDGAKKFGKAMFTNKDGSIDKAAVMGAIAFAGSYAEARALAAETGLDDDLTEEEYNEALREEKKEEYAGYLTNFFGGNKDGGRIGFKFGTNKILGLPAEEFKLEGNQGDQLDLALQMLLRDNKDNELLKYALDTAEERGTSKLQVLMDLMKNQKVLDAIAKEDGIMASDLISVKDLARKEGSMKDGGRIGFKFGTKPKQAEIGIMSIDVEAGDDDDTEDMNMAAGINFSRQEKSYLFKRLGGSGGADRSYTMPNLYRILNNPGRYPEDAAILKEIAIMGLGENRADGGRIGFNDGSSTGNFGADRYASELVEAYESLLNKGDLFLTDVEQELLEKGEYPSPDKMKEFITRYENLEKEYEQGENKFDNINLQDSLFDKDALKYYNKKIKDLENREERLMDKEDKLNEVMYTDLDVSGILRTPEFQEWYSLWKVKDPKADDLPNAEYFENMMFDTKRLRPDFMKTKYDSEMKAKGGRIGYKGGANRVSELLILRDGILAKDANADVSDIEAEIFQLTGKVFKSIGGIGDIPTGKLRQNSAGVIERDYRDEGGFVPVGVKERADDVPAMLSKNEFVMTADAVRGIGGGDVEKGSKKLYNTMKQAEKVGKA